MATSFLNQIAPARSQFFDGNGAPLVGGTVTTYIPDTTAPVTTYQDPNGDTLNDNPLILDSLGSAVIWYNGLLRMVVKDVDGNQLYDQVSGDGELGSIANYAALRTYAGNAKYIFVYGASSFAQSPTGATGWFYLDGGDSGSSDNGGTIIVSNSGARWHRIYSGAIDVRWFGATGDGSADDTAAFQAAANTGLSFFVPATAASFRLSSRITLTGNGQSISGEGALSKIVQTGVDDNAEIFFFNASTDNAVKDLMLVPGSTTSGLSYRGAAILFSGCTRCSAIDNFIKGHIRGIIFLNCQQGRASGNYVHDSPVWTTPTSAFGDDIAVLGNSAGIVISDNVLKNGSGEGISIATLVTTGSTITDVSVTGNIIDGEGSYGVLVYSDGANAVGANPDTFSGIVITGNTIANITGLNPNPFDGELDFGAGIYIQGVEGVVVTGNTLRNTNTDTNNELLSPAAISVGNARRVTITGNTIDSPSYYGIQLNDANNKGDPNGIAVVSSNTVNGAVKSGIYCKDSPRVVVIGNVVTNGADNGLTISNANAALGLSRDFKILGNIFNANALSGIDVESGSVFIDNNSCEGNAVSGISIASPYNCVVTNNFIANNTVRGLYYNPSAVTTNCILTRDNVLDTNGIHVIANGPVRSIEENLFSNPLAGAAGAITGTYATNTIANNMSGATPSVVASSRFWTKTDTTTVTNFTDGRIGQEIIVQATAGDLIISHGANIATKSGADVTVLNGTTISFFNFGNWREI